MPREVLWSIKCSSSPQNFARVFKPVVLRGFLSRHARRTAKEELLVATEIVMLWDFLNCWQGSNEEDCMFTFSKKDK